jgi:hypothetical protein
MDLFTEVYDKTRNLLQTPQLHTDWADTEAALKSLILPDGPSVSKAAALEDLRKRLRAAGKKDGVPAAAEANEICRASVTTKPGFQDRAALIKQMKHFYLVMKKGNQSVWVVDQPKSYGEWDYALFNGKPAVDLPPMLAQGQEVFGPANRKMMSDALQLARKWSADTQVKLGRNSAATDAAIRRWFHEEGASDSDVASTRAALTEGFKKITASCNSGKIIFSDRPAKRVSGTYDTTYASVNSGDTMPIIYLYELFLATGKRNLFGRIPKLWLCALTIVHELSHKLVDTKDIRYDDQGLKPSPAFPHDKALTNADSWAYFCGDVLGAVPKHSVQQALS